MKIELFPVCVGFNETTASSLPGITLQFPVALNSNSTHKTSKWHKVEAYSNFSLPDPPTTSQVFTYVVSKCMCVCSERERVVAFEVPAIVPIAHALTTILL